MYASKNYLFLAVFLFVLGFASPSVSLAYSDCVPSFAPTLPCQKPADPSVVYDTFATGQQWTISTNTVYTSGNYSFYKSSDYNTHIDTLYEGTTNAMTRFRWTQLTSGVGHTMVGTISTAFVFSAPTYSANNSPDWVWEFLVGNSAYGVREYRHVWLGADLNIPDLTPTHTLSVTSPTLTLDNADVQPSSAFLVNFSYVDTNYSGDYSDVRFSLSSCNDDTCSTTTLLDSGLLSTIRATLGSGLDGSIYARVPAVLGIPLNYVAILTDADANVQYSSVVFSLTGSYATGLPLPDDALYPTDTTVPDLMTDPSGFVSAMFTNFGNYLVRLVIPPLSFFTDSFSQIQSGFSTKFAFFEQLRSAFTVPADGSFTPITLTGITIAGSTISPIAFISSFNPTTFAPFRNFLSMVMYVGLGFWLIKKTSLIFSS